jgi:hypothetical protein
MSRPVRGKVFMASDNTCYAGHVCRLRRSSYAGRTGTSFMNERRKNAFATVYDVPHERGFGMFVGK